eukprot:NODE_19693_length_831_cov_7.055398.p1 GENE.NODE_19693_length_831_cov_7.055398~~NODE_19693_length_831_cov_7.055398.p1  ORF type:complete len:90 (+),score=8.77 NODE_19693_length_831_cov_7.055398:560-829(+)
MAQPLVACRSCVDLAAARLNNSVNCRRTTNQVRLISNEPSRSAQPMRVSARYVQRAAHACTCAIRETRRPSRRAAPDHRASDCTLVVRT